MERKAGMPNALRSVLKAADVALRTACAASGRLSAGAGPDSHAPDRGYPRRGRHLGDRNTADISRALEQAGSDRAVRAVVLDVSSPGGEVSASEGLYFDMLKLREIKTGRRLGKRDGCQRAYYIACAADRIYAKPASMIGNIGVISVLGEEDLVDEVLITTGPFKLSGGSQDAYIRQMELLKQTFLAAIMAQRQDGCRWGLTCCRAARLYLGLQAQQMGLIDAIGSQAEATAEAARLAKVRHYRLWTAPPSRPWSRCWLSDEPAGRSTAATVADLPQSLPPGCYYRYVEPLP